MHTFSDLKAFNFYEICKKKIKKNLLKKNKINKCTAAEWFYDRHTDSPSNEYENNKVERKKIVFY